MLICSQNALNTQKHSKRNPRKSPPQSAVSLYLLMQHFNISLAWLISSSVSFESNLIMSKIPKENIRLGFSKLFPVCSKEKSFNIFPISIPATYTFVDRPVFSVRINSGTYLTPFSSGKYSIGTPKYLANAASLSTFGLLRPFITPHSLWSTWTPQTP